MSQCIGKQPYEDHAVAERVAELYTRTNYQKRTFRVYTDRCPICGMWHLTSQTLRQKR